MRGEEITENMQQTMAEEEIHTVEIDDPYAGGDSSRFAVRFTFDSTFRSTGERRHYSKISLYTVAGGKLVREEVYFSARRISRRRRDEAALDRLRLICAGGHEAREVPQTEPVAVRVADRSGTRHREPFHRLAGDLCDHLEVLVQV